MTVVSNTSPLSYLVLIRQIEPLPRLFSGITIPSEVRMELSHPAAAPEIRR